MKTVLLKFFPRTGLVITIIVLFILFEGLSFVYIRQHSNDAGYNHHPRIHIMHYYNHALGNSDALNTAVMYIHWPLLKMEGLLSNCNVSMLNRHKYIEVHRIRNKPK